jgi:hypothetical protein
MQDLIFAALIGGLYGITHALVLGLSRLGRVE